MKKKIIVILLLVLFIFTGCNKEKEVEKEKTENGIMINNKEVPLTYERNLKNMYFKENISLFQSSYYR